METAPTFEPSTWVREYLAPRHPELVEPYLKAVTIQREALAQGSLREQDIDHLLVCARSRHRALSENVAAMMGKLAPVDTKIHRAIRRLANGALRHERVNALVALDSCSVKALEIELLTGLLKDKSGKVRALAADKIVGNGLLELEHELAVAASAEQNPGVADELLACLEYLRHGFRAVQTGDLIWVSCRPARRGSVGQFFTEQEFKAKGAAWVAEVLNEA